MTMQGWYAVLERAQDNGFAHAEYAIAAGEVRNPNILATVPTLELVEKAGGIDLYHLADEQDLEDVSVAWMDGYNSVSWPRRRRRGNGTGGKCGDCGGPCHKKSRRCMDCTSNRPNLTCRTCGNDFPRAEFESPDGTRVSYCKDCRATHRREAHFREKYGIDIATYEDMLTAQNGGCAICGRADGGPGRTTRLQVDHCHSTGRVRGLLCMHCNHAIGKFGDDPAVLQRAIAYLINSQLGDQLPTAENPRRHHGRRGFSIHGDY